jgi:hypothetical protein
MKIYQAAQKLLVGDTQTDRQTNDLISLLSFLETDSMEQNASREADSHSTSQEKF